jgi:hypothetical protein
MSPFSGGLFIVTAIPWFRPLVDGSKSKGLRFATIPVVGVEEKCKIELSMMDIITNPVSSSFRIVREVSFSQFIQN